MDVTARQFEIIEAAGKLLTEGGVGKLTTKRLAQEIGFSEAALYRHFASKEAIVTTMLNYLAEEMDARLKTTIQQSDDPATQLKLVFETQFKFFESHSYFVIAVFSDGLMEESTVINQAILKIMSVKFGHLKAIISQGQITGAFSSEIAAEEMIHIVMGTFRLLMFQWRASNFEFDLRDAGKRRLEAVFTLIKSK